MLRFLKSTSGSFVPVFAVALVPMVAAVGFAVDYTDGVRTRSDMQNALDAAALTATIMPTSTSSGDRAQKLQDAFAANGGEGAAKLESFTVDSDGTAHLAASSLFPVATMTGAARSAWLFSTRPVTWTMVAGAASFNATSPDVTALGLDEANPSEPHAAKL